MHGIKAIIRKELADHFSSYRFMILFALITMVSIIMAYMVGLNIRQELSGIAKPKFVFLMLFTSSGTVFSLVNFVALFGPLVGLMMGFDAINRERNEGTLSKLLSQPIYRDAIINGKFIAGVFMIAVMLLSIVLVITGLGLIMIGVVPGPEELWRIFIYLLISLFYISFWLGIAIFFSIVFRSVATSALATLACWIFFSFFVSLGASAVANSLSSSWTSDPDEAYVMQAHLQKVFSLVSPMQLYTDATEAIIDPMRRTTKTVIHVGVMEQLSMSRFSGPLPLAQSILVVLPYMISIIAITMVCFGLSYAVFMRQEVRSL